MNDGRLPLASPALPQLLAPVAPEVGLPSQTRTGSSEPGHHCVSRVTAYLDSGLTQCYSVMLCLKTAVLLTL